MDYTKFQSFLKGYPFLQRVNSRWGHQRNPLYCDRIEIAPISQELLDYMPCLEVITGAKAGIDNGERIDFVLRDGSILLNAVACSGRITYGDCTTDGSLSGETVIEAIMRKDLASTDIEYIVKLKYGYNICDHYSLENYSIYIYKKQGETMKAKDKTDFVKNWEDYTRYFVTLLNSTDKMDIADEVVRLREEMIQLIHKVANELELYD